MTFKPLLAATLKDETLDNLNYPVLVSRKLDGIRAIIIDGVVTSRNMKPIPNHHVQYLFGLKELNGLDGELIVGEPNDPNVYNHTASGVMSHDGEPDVTYWVFDKAFDEKDPNWSKLTFDERRRAACRIIEENSHGNHSARFKLAFLPHTQVDNKEQLLAQEQQVLLRGYEGLMVRSPIGVYKHGRSTLRDGIIAKLKRFKDDEATIIGFKEANSNQNELTRDELGRAKRSGHKANLVPKDTLGAVMVRNKEGKEFDIGSGFDDAMRKQIWTNQEAYLGKIVKYKFFEVGVKDLPRFPIFLGFRDEIDL